MATSLRLTTTLQARGPAAAIVLTDEQVADLAGGPKTFPVVVTVVGGETFRGRLARMGGENLIGLNKNIREAVGVGAGDSVEVVVALDTGERAVEVPDDLLAALAHGDAAEAFAALAPSHRKEYVRWITEAKKADTRAKRVAEAVPMIRDGRPRR